MEEKKVIEFKDKGADSRTNDLLEMLQDWRKKNVADHPNRDVLIAGLFGVLDVSEGGKIEGKFSKGVLYGNKRLILSSLSVLMEIVKEVEGDYINDTATLNFEDLALH